MPPPGSLQRPQSVQSLHDEFAGSEEEAGTSNEPHAEGHTEFKISLPKRKGGLRGGKGGMMTVC